MNNVYATTALMQVARPDTAPALAYCLQSRKQYAYYSDSATLTRTGVVLPAVGDDVLVTGNGGNSRWVSLRYWQSARVGKNANQTIATGATTLVTFNVVDHDPFVSWDAANNRLIAITGGQYYAQFDMRWLDETTTAAHIYSASLRLNGAIISTAENNPRSLGYSHYSTGVNLVMTASQYVDAVVSQNSGSNKTVFGSTLQTYLLLFKIS